MRVQWLTRYNDADLLPPEPRAAAVDKLTAELERDLHLIGSTAIEDKLQQGVPETILRCLTANIKVWVLTGDKMVRCKNPAPRTHCIDFYLSSSRAVWLSLRKLRLRLRARRA